MYLQEIHVCCGVMNLQLGGSARMQLQPSLVMVQIKSYRRPQVYVYTSASTLHPHSIVINSLHCTFGFK